MINVVTQLGANTGQSIGDVRMGRPKAFFFTRGFEFAPADLLDSDSLFAALTTAMNLSRTHINKVFMFTGFHEADDNTGDPQEQSLADGYSEVLNEALAKYTLKHTAGVAQTQSFVEFNGWEDGVYVLDDKNLFWYRGKSNNGGRFFDVGALYSTYPRFGNTGNINTGLTKITFGTPEDFKQGLGCVKLTHSISELPNMVDVTLAEGAVASGYAFKIVARNKYTGTNIYQTYADLLNVVGAWKISKKDGTVVTVASVAKDATLDSNNGGWTVTANSTPTINPATELYIELVDPTALAALTTSVTGIESFKVKVLKP
jgi:hypothetical protein